MFNNARSAFRLAIPATLVALVLAIPVASASASATPASPALAAATQHAINPTPPIPPAPGQRRDYPSSDFAAAAAKLPAALVAAIHRDLGITSEAYLAQAAAADDASRTLMALKQEGVTIRGSRMEGTLLRAYVSNQADAAAVEKLGAVADLGPVVVAPKPPAAFVKASDVYDGSAYEWNDGTSATFCSVGFGGFQVSTGARQSVTAGHCFENINTIQGQIHSVSMPVAGNYGSATDAGVLGDLAAGSNTFGGGNDSALIAVTGASVVQKPSALTWGGGAGAPLASSPTPIYDVSTASVGESVCKSGSRTGWSCGTVLAVDEIISVGGSAVNAVLTTACVLPGDSGGALIAGNFALGVISASTAATSCGASTQSAAFQMVSPGGGASIARSHPDWEPAVTIPTPNVTAPSSAGAATNFLGGQVASTSQSLIAKLYVDGSTAPITSPAPYGVFNIPLTSVAAGTHSYELKLTWGTWSTSTSLSGTFRKVSEARIAGSDRFVNADLIAKQAYPSGATTVYVTNGLNYPDALSAGPVAVRDGAPILLTLPTSLPADVSSTITTLHPANIVVLGGVNSVSSDVFQTLQALVADPTKVIRVGGADRFDASRNLASTYGTAATVFISNGLNFPDALSAGPAAATVNAPLLLVNGPQSSLPAETLQLFSHLGTSKIVIVGGPNSVSPSIESQLDGIFGSANVVRFGGATRYDASVNINAAYFRTATGAMIATGEIFPDALAGGAYAGKLGEPLYTVPHNCVPGATSAAIASLGVDSVLLLGGTNTLYATVGTLNKC